MRQCAATSSTRFSSGSDHGRPLRTGSAPSRRGAVISLPNCRRLTPVNGAVQDGSDAVYDAPRLAHLLCDLPVQVLARMRSDRVLRRPVPSRQPHTRGRPPRHGGEFVFGQPGTWGAPDTETVTGYTRLYGTALAGSWDRLHPSLTHRSSWAAAAGTLPIVGVTIDPPGHRAPAQRSHPEAGLAAVVRPGVDAADTDRLWQAYLRRFEATPYWGRWETLSTGQPPTRRRLHRRYEGRPSLPRLRRHRRSPHQLPPTHEVRLPASLHLSSSVKQKPHEPQTVSPTGAVCLH